MDADTSPGLLDSAEERGEIGLDLILQVRLIVIRAHDQQSGTSDGALKTRGTNLDTERRLDLLVVDVGGLQPQFP